MFDSDSSLFARGLLAREVDSLKICLGKLIILIFFVMSTDSRAQKEIIPPVESAPQGSWEAWLQSIRRGETKPRPDALPLMARLPAWVDCHLSWSVDQRSLKRRSSKIPPELVLRASPKLCEGQLEQWAK